MNKKLLVLGAIMINMISMYAQEKPSCGEILQLIKKELKQSDNISLIKKHEDREIFVENSNYKIFLNSYSGILYNKENHDGINIFIHQTEYDKIKDFSILKKKTIELLNFLPNNINHFNNEKACICITSKHNEEELILMLYLNKDNFYGFLYNIGFSGNYEPDRAFQKLRQDGINSIIWYGDKLKRFKILEEASKNRVSLIRRSRFNYKNLPNIGTDIDLAFQQQFVPASSYLVNAIPSTKSELKRGGFSVLNIQEWMDFKGQIEKLSEGKFLNSSIEINAFKKELIQGENNILFIVAHADEYNFFIGNIKVSVDEIKKWTNRVKNNDKLRFAIFISCNTGKIEQQKNFMILNKNVMTLTELFLEKGYFDYIISPDHEIDKVETINIFKEMLSIKSFYEIQQTLKGWGIFAQMNNSKNKDRYE